MNTQPTPNGEPVLNHRQQKSAAVAQRIYAEFRWNLKKAAGLGKGITWPQVAELIDAAIRCCMDLIPDQTIRQQCIAQFQRSRDKVMVRAQTESKADITLLTGDACVKCHHEFAVDEPKTWVADGQFVCAKCQ